MHELIHQALPVLVILLASLSLARAKLFQEASDFTYDTTAYLGHPTLVNGGVPPASNPHAQVAYQALPPPDAWWSVSYNYPLFTDPNHAASWSASGQVAQETGNAIYHTFIPNGIQQAPVFGVVAPRILESSHPTTA